VSLVAEPRSAYRSFGSFPLWQRIGAVAVSGAFVASVLFWTVYLLVGIVVSVP
jgi:hypothetical protein